MASSRLNITISATDDASGILGKISGSLSGLASAALAPAKGLGGLADVLGKVGLAGLGLKTIAEGIAGIATGMVSGNAQMETYQTQLGTLLGSADAAKERLAELAKFGAETPFELPEVVRAEKVLLGFGLTGQKALDLTGKSATDLRTIIGDVAAGTGASFEEIALNFGKLSAGATGEAISRFQELGIVTREQLAAMGVEFSKSGELISPLPIAMAAMTKIAQQKFGGGMDALSKTFEGQMSTLSDNFNQAKNVVTQPIFDVLKESVAGLNTLMGSDGFQRVLKDVAAFLAGGVASAVELAKSGFNTLKGVVDKVSGVLSQVAGYLDANNQFDLMRAWFGPNFGPVIDIAVRGLKGLVSGISDVAKRIGELVSGKISLGDFVESLRSSIASIDFASIWSGIKGFGTGLVSAIASTVGGIDLTGTFAGLTKTAVNIWGWVSKTTTDLTAGLTTAVAAVDWAGVWSGISKAKISADIFIINLVTGLAAGIADAAVQISSAFSAWIAPFTAWIGPATADFLGKWPTMLSGFLDTIGATVLDAAITIGTQLAAWGQAFVNWIGPALPGIGLGLLQITGAVLAFIAETLVTLNLKVLQWGAAFIGWIAPQIPGILLELAKLQIALIGWILNTALPAIANQVKVWADAFLPWVAETIPKLVIELGKLMLAVGDWITTVALPAITAQVNQWATAFVAWVTETVPKMLDALGKMLADLGAWFTKTAVPFMVSQGAEFGKSLMNGIRQGISSIQIPIPRVDIRVVHGNVGGVGFDVPAFDLGVDWKSIGSIIGLANGGNLLTDGSVLVGERGPEILNLPRGAQVAPLRGGGSGIDYDALARTLAAQPIVLQLDGETLGRVTRSQLVRMTQREGADLWT
jgi:hypothetical protein